MLNCLKRNRATIDLAGLFFPIRFSLVGICQCGVLVWELNRFLLLFLLQFKTPVVSLETATVKPTADLRLFSCFSQ